MPIDMTEVIGMGEQDDAELDRIRIKKLKALIDIQQGYRNSEKGSDWPNGSITVSDTTFFQTINDYPLVVIDCWAQWCGPCHVLAPVIEELAKDYIGKIIFGKLDTDLNKMSADRFNVRSIPTLLVFKNGKLVDKLVGAMSKEMLEPMITKHLSR